MKDFKSEFPYSRHVIYDSAPVLQYPLHFHWGGEFKEGKYWNVTNGLSDDKWP